MKKVIVLAIAVVAVWLGINFARTGKVAFFPPPGNPAEERVHAIEREIQPEPDRIRGDHDVGFAFAETPRFVAPHFRRQIPVDHGHAMTA